MNTTPGVHIELVNLPDSAVQDWAQWYDDTYLKARTKLPGVYSARRLKGLIGSVQNMVVYDLSNFLIPYSQEWRDLDASIAADSPPSASVSKHLDGRESSVYRQIFSMHDAPYEPEDVGIFHGAFFEVPSRDQDEFNDWYNTEHVEFVRTVEGYLNCRRFQALEEPTKFCALYDVVELRNSEAKDVHPQNYTPWANRVRAKLPTYRDRRIFSVERRERGER